jgi:hypothetical protein
MNHLYEVATGRLRSSTILDIPDIPDGMAVKVSNLTGIWNVSELDFEPKPVKRIITKLDFIGRFTDPELEAIISKSKEANTIGDKVGVFLKKLDVAQDVDLDDARLNAGVNGMETLGLIGAGRAAVILNG